ncbi:class I SAM-dependent methyltransferase [Calothrix sp. NIES-2098]|uniref:class I SAM-dependent methyltransferase n=1 Tax=Calothrix sp. NIES-2098 TaxID=1954171 RepID=UPI000B60E81A|nr:hypothetical protein NIES2098_03620 [Calothrix sp. NIES-2098]
MNMQTIDRFQFCPQLTEILENRQVIGKTGKVFNRLGAASTENNLWALRSLSLELNPKNTLEIGLAYGTSCLALAATHRDLEHVPNRQHVAIDPFQSTIWDDTGKLIIEKANLHNYVDMREDFSYSVLPQLITEGLMFDLIYIDGSHLFEDVFIDFFYSNKLLSEKGVIMFDDSSDPHIRKVLKFIDSNFAFSYKKLDLSYLYTGWNKFKYNFGVKIQKTQLTVYQKTGKTVRPWNAKLNEF